MVEAIACVEWIQRNVFNVGRRNTGLEGLWETPKEVERRRHGNQEYMQPQRAAMAVEQRRLERTRNVQVNMST